jgi:hypothetical protein
MNLTGMPSALVSLSETSVHCSSIFLASESGIAEMRISLISTFSSAFSAG